MQAAQKDRRGAQFSWIVFVVRVRKTSTRNEHDFREAFERRNEAYESFSAVC
jgi:hypothetical protein